MTCYAPSKTFNIAGMHCSVAIVPDEGLRKRFNDARSGIQGSPDLFAVYAMEAAFKYGDEWLDCRGLGMDARALRKFFNEKPGWGRTTARLSAQAEKASSG